MEQNATLISDIRGSDRPFDPSTWFVPDVDENEALYYKSDLKPKRRDQDVWNDKYNYVRMPHSDRSFAENGELRWNVITRALRAKINQSYDLADTILTYNPSYRGKWTFATLHSTMNSLTDDERNRFFGIILPKIARLALSLPQKIQAPIPLLRKNNRTWLASLSLTNDQIACLLANAFFCTFPDRNEKSYHYSNMNFSKLFMAEGSDVAEKIKCIIKYFERADSNGPSRVLTFARRSVSDREVPIWSESRVPLRSVQVRTDTSLKFEEGFGLIQLDFANKYIGGGVIGHGSVQEEIRFVKSPELLVAKLFCEKMDDNEAIMMTGSELYNNHIGYSRSFEWMGEYRDDAPLDYSKRRMTAILAIDAKFFEKNTRDEYKKKNVDRELNKAWVGFSFYTDPHKSRNYPGVVTGNWGCGAFHGTPQLKSLLQLMACAEAGRPMLYVTFGDKEFSKELYQMYQNLKRRNVTVGQLYRKILDFYVSDYNNLFDFLNSFNN